MRISKIDYQKVFNTGNFTSQRYTVEIVLEEGDSEMTAIRMAKESVEKFHYDKYEEQRGTTVRTINGELPVIQVNEL